MRSVLLGILLIPVVTRSGRADDTNERSSKDVPSSLTAPFDAAQAAAAQVAWAKSLGKSSPVEKNSIEMEFVLIPPGKFTTGSPPSEKQRKKNEVQVDVTLTKAFYLGKTEVTQGQWRAIMGTTPWKGQLLVREGDDYPATHVGWDDAQAFCKKLSEKKDEAAYRLPTEAEWEYACRGGTTTQFSFGNDESKLSNYAWWGGIDGDGNAKDEKYAHEVGRKKPNPFGLHDMHGNVWEFCEDEYADKLPGGTDPLAPDGGQVKVSVRVFRGGGWFNDAARCRSGDRNRDPSGFRYFFLGFRVVRMTD